MAPQQAVPDIAPSPRREAIFRAVGIAAAVAAATLAVTLSVRPIASFDLGYHLAYGDHFLRTGEIVQTNRFIYTHLEEFIPPGAGGLGPGCRYDAETDTYHFVNANWLSQVIMSAAHRAGGLAALWVLQPVMVAAIFALIILALRRRRVGWHWVAAAVVLAAMTAYERFNLRPEVFGYLVLLGQWCLLSSRQFRWRSAAGVVGLQLLAVNLHGYFLLGIALTGAMFADAMLRWLWARAVTGREVAPAGVRLKWFALAAGGVVLASLCNPWHVRGAVMPVQTLLYVREHHIAGWTHSGVESHPWATISEFAAPFADHMRDFRATKALMVLLGLTGLAGVVAVIGRRWGWALVLAGMTGVCLGMRRNISPAAMILAPLAVIVLADGWRRLAEGLAGKIRPQLSQRLARAAALAAALASAGLAVWWTAAVVGQRFYFADLSKGSPRRSSRLAWRFGTGVSTMQVPLDAVDWINTHQPAGTAFTDYDTSSNLMYFTDPRQEVPVLTNTWAFPPRLYRRILEYATAGRELKPFLEAYDVGFVVLRSSPTTQELIAKLAGEADWAVVHLGAAHVIFLRRRGPNAELAAENALTPANFQLEEFLQRIAGADPVPAYPLYKAAMTLGALGWSDQAIDVLRACLREEQDYFEALAWLGQSLLLRGNRRMMRCVELLNQQWPDAARPWQDKALADWREAEQCLDRALKIRPTSQIAKAQLRGVQRQISDLVVRGRYVPLKMKAQ